MNRTKIDWATHTWNPVWGCRNACPYCYARATAHRWDQSFEPHWRQKNFDRPMPKAPGARIFVNSMSEIAYWEPEWWDRVMERIEDNQQHTFMFLTKDPHAYDERRFPDNCSLGVTVTRQREMDALAEGVFSFQWDNKSVFFLSIEPMLESINLRMHPDWIILGAETGNRKNRVIPPAEWIQPFLNITTPVFMKHNLPWSGRWRKEFPA